MKVAALLDAIITQSECFEIHRIYPMLPETLKDYLSRCNRSDKGKILRVIAALTERNA